MNNENWLKHYRTNKQAVWLKCELTDGKEFFFEDYSAWKIIKNSCEQSGAFVKDFRLQFRSHEVKVDIDSDNDEAIYFVRSVMGKLGGVTSEYYTVGILRDNKVHKQMWLIPELIIDKEFDDDISECFEEAIIYNEKKKKN